MLTVQKHSVASSRDWKSQLYLSRYAHSSLQKQAWKWPVCSRVNIEDLESISSYTWGEEDTQRGMRKAICPPSTNLPPCFFPRHSGGTVGARRVKKGGKFIISDRQIITDKLQVSRQGCDAASQETGDKKTATWDGAAALTAKTSTAQLCSHSTRPSLSEQRRLNWGRIGRSLKLKNVCSISRNI